MSEDMNEIDVNGKREENAKETPQDNPLAEDPMNPAESGRDLACRLRDVVNDLEWRQAARDHQARVIAILEDLKRPASARAAEWKALDERQVARTVPDSAATAKALLGRLLIKCEDAVGELFRERDLHRFGLVGQLAHASARLVAMLDQVDRGAPAAKPRKVRGKRP